MEVVMVVEAVVVAVGVRADEKDADRVLVYAKQTTTATMKMMNKNWAPTLDEKRYELLK